MSKSNDTFDPRFDPAFQPGFSGPAPTVARKRQVSPAQAALEARTEAVAETVEAVPSAGEQDAVETTRRPNPFLLALAAISLILIAGGLAAVQQIQGVFATENISVDIDYVTLDMIKFAAPLAVALGVATGIGVLFLYAVGWNRAHR
jgi:hypothetical protein